MKGALLASVVTPHSPKIAIEGKAPPSLRGVASGSVALGRAIRAMAPDVLVVQSSHWVTPFFWFVTTHDRHVGSCDQEDVPSPLATIVYNRPGDPVFAHALIEGMVAAGMPCTGIDAPDFTWDYGTGIPLRHFDPGGTIPVVLLGTCLLSSLDECDRVGTAIRLCAERTGRRVVFVASSAFAARLVRGPVEWPSRAALAADRRLLDLLCAGDVAGAKAWLPSYARTSHAELGAKPLATFLGCLDDRNGRFAGQRFGDYGPAAGSGIVNVAVWPDLDPASVA